MTNRGCVTKYTDASTFIVAHMTEWNINDDKYPILCAFDKILVRHYKESYPDFPILATSLYRHAVTFFSAHLHTKICLKNRFW